MNKYQEALGYITDNFIDNIEVKDGQPMNKETECIMTLQELVDKVTPIKVIKAAPYGTTRASKCPICNKRYSRAHKKGYCPNCGQKFDWSDE